MVVGGSIGAVRTVQGLRREGYGGRIRLLTEELVEPYDRPPLSKQYLAGSRSLDQFTLLTQEAAGDLDVEMVLGARAVGIDPDWDVVQLADGSRISYEHLVVATGSSPRVTPWDTVEGVLSLRDLQDADQLRRALDGASSIAVVGAGFVGAEVAATARGLGLDVTMIDPLPHPMARVLGGALADRFIELHQDRGANLLLSTRVESIQRDASGIQLSLSDSTVLTCDVVVIGIGTVPNTGWLSGAGLDLVNGVACDARGRATDVAGIYAVGDAARWLDPHDGVQRRHEHWTNAVEQAAVVAKVIVHGDAPEHRPRPYVWSDQYDWQIQVLGDPARGELIDVIENEPVISDGAAPRPRFAAVYGASDGNVVGAVIVSWPRATLTLRRSLASTTTTADATTSVQALTAR
ncbi:phthalate 3,4-dioxygenase, ferredoxin reductase subunit [Geodermatophilus amargosae]|uniref:Phthalate 3,4-dioxygenase, ferredoxin reductase subunit n=1 Tax=Geodermatophilus amargosae TaxID=1296565 RepID=A0A1I7B5G9_9ACTN|nr:FAD/NAD(P)-binding oxidoreductase [Geodermatophilus amargosae]SFT82402.1 phthalate 3,4-dioxygenase, ferredoxin reductase subunit [Geodermatophilus amargosae]